MLERYQQLIAVPRILAVEDDVHQLELYQRFLERCQCEFFGARYVADGKKICEVTPISVVLLDLRFPGGESGVEFLRWRKTVNYPARVNILTNFLGGEELNDALPFGGFYLAQKPYTQEQLLEVLVDSGVILHPKPHGT